MSNKSAPAFTPGPWESVRNEAPHHSGWLCIEAPTKDRNIVAEVWPIDSTGETTRANARLIAAAPALYAALEALYNRVERDGLLYKGSNPMLPALAALRAARGEP